VSPRRAVAALAVLLAAAAPRAAEPPGPPSREDIARWVKQLGAEDFETREQASKKLWEAGARAEPDLEKALAEADDVETRRRVAEILERFRWGVYPDTPKEVLERIGRYQVAEPAGKLAVVDELMGLGLPGARTVVKIAGVEKDPNVRRELLGKLTNDMARLAPTLLLDDGHATLEKLLDLTLEQEYRLGVGHYAAYGLLRGDLDARIDRFRGSEKNGTNPKRDAEILARLYRAKGDAAAALDAARRSGNEELVDALLFEAGDWKELARRHADAGGDAERLGYRAAYCRLAGDREGFEAALASLRAHVAELKPGTENENRLFGYARAFFLNGRPAEGLAALERAGLYADAYEILGFQGRFDEAFALIEKARAAGSRDLPRLEILHARTLCLIGERDKATPIFARYAEQIKPGADFSWFEDLVEAEFLCGLKDEAFDHAVGVLGVSNDQGWPTRLFRKLFPGRGETAEALWRFLVNHGPENGDRPGAMKRLRRLMDGKADAAEVRELLEREANRKWKEPPRPEDVAAERLALAEIALAAGLGKEGEELLTRADTAAAWLRLGDRRAEGKEWDQAAAAYRRSWEKEPSRPLPLFLHGQALLRAGRPKEGNKAVEDAHWIALGDDELRHRFAVELVQRGHDQEARRENDLLLRVAEPGEFHAGEAFRRNAHAALKRGDYRTAADAQERSMLFVLRPHIFFLSKGAYVLVPALVTSLRAQELVAAGKVPEALALVERYREMMPNGLEAATGLVPQLEKAGQTKEADALFDATLKAQLRLARDHPRWAHAHNGVAWLSACCRRNLDPALEHALKAVELAPENAGYLDTLAEVYFQRGERDKALEAERKALRLAPQRGYLQKQLRRMEAGDPKAPLPLEDEDD
jgi:tetratricopeptide (TPR) repeat protein